ncbi:hypothetical protein [Nafulsella turpanensis]|uniref:hypothetical protein n=1 Tax=Nafulsella turpanensis TaxID=1265690 RepID=UPI000367049B|nr:hypothetical protein [Nafulsella turpanensis]
MANIKELTAVCHKAILLRFFRIAFITIELMNKKNIFFLFLTFFSLTGFLQAQDKPFILEGRLLNAEDSSGIGFSHIINNESGLRTASDAEGYFRLPVNAGDTLLVSSVTFGQKKVLAPAKAGRLFIIRLAPNVYELDEVVVNSLPSEQKLKELLLSMETPDGKPKPDLRLPEDLPVEVIEGTGGVSVGGVFSGIAGRFSKKERGRKFLAEVEVKDTKKAYILTKYNRDIVKKITGLEDEEELDAFMQYCRLSENFLYEATEYEIHEAVLGYFKTFRPEQEG